jgi:hypothetical protein
MLGDAAVTSTLPPASGSMVKDRAKKPIDHSLLMLFDPAHVCEARFLVDEHSMLKRTLRLATVH